MSTSSSIVNLDGWIKVASRRSRSLRGPGTKSLDGANLLELFQEVRLDSAESPEFRNLGRKARSLAALRIKSRSKGRRREGRRRSGSKQSSVLEALAAAEMSDSICNDLNSPFEAILENEGDGFMNATKAPTRRVNSDWIIESPSKVFLRRPRTDDLRSSSGVYSESTATTTSTFDDEQPVFDDGSFNSKLSLSPTTYTASDISDDLQSLSLASSSPSPFRYPRSSSSPFTDDSLTLFSSVWRSDAPKPVIASSLGLPRCPWANERKFCSSTCPYVHPGPTDNGPVSRPEDGDIFVLDPAKARMVFLSWPTTTCVKADAVACQRDQDYWSSVLEAFTPAPKESHWPETGGRANTEASPEKPKSEHAPSLSLVDWLLSGGDPEDFSGNPFSPFITDELALRNSEETGI